MIQINRRDSKIKCKKLRRQGVITGTLRRCSGEIISISVKGSSIDTFVNNNGLNEELIVIFENKKIKTRIYKVQRNLMFHNIDNIDLIEKN